MNIAVIPARGGSKIPRKNISLFYGKPMIAWPIEILKNSQIFDKIIISTDDKEIADIAIDCGVEVPFMRPANISDDVTGTGEVMSHAVHWMQKKGFNLRAVCCIYATSLFLKVSDLKKGLKVLDSGQWKYSFSVTDYDSSIFRSFEKSANGGVKMFSLNTIQNVPKICLKHFTMQHSFIRGLPEAWTNNLKLFEDHSYHFLSPAQESKILIIRMIEAS